MVVSPLRLDRLGREGSGCHGSALGPLLAVLLALIGMSAAQAATPTPAAPTSVQIMPLASIRAGMTGYGLTVFQGLTPERFNIRVIGILHQHLPGMDIILIESQDPRLVHSGIAAGMSGSPIYIEGRLIGALAYGWLFSKDAIAGVTPIEYMLKDLRRPQRLATSVGELPQTAALDAGTGRFVASLPERRSLRAMVGDPAGAPDTDTVGRLLPPRLGAGPGAIPESRLVRAAVPLSVAGLGEHAIEELRQVLGPYGLVPLQASGAGTPGRRGPERFEPGGSLAVELIRGDLSAAGTGTVTYIEGGRVAAFGHQMLNAGEVLLPISTAEIVTIMSSQMSSFKMSSPLEVKGALVQDRQSGVFGDVNQRAPSVPMQVTVRTSGAGANPALAAPTEQIFRTELAKHRFLTAPLAQSVVSSALQAGAADITDAVVEVQSRLQLQGFAPLEQTDYFFSPGGASEKLVLGTSGIKQLHDLLLNPFAPVRIDRLDVRIAVSYRSEVSEIVGVTMPGDELEPDTRPNVQVLLRPYGASSAAVVRTVPVEIPRWLAGQSLKIEASAGQLVKPEVAPPENLPDLVENLRKGYSARSLVLTLSVIDEGVTLRGRLVPSLPASVIATLRPGGASKRGEPFKRVSRVVVDMGTVLSGKQELTVLVRDDR